MRDISAVVSSVRPSWAMWIAVAPFSRTSPVAVMNSAAILSHDSFSLNFSVERDDERIGDDRRAVFQPADEDHIAPIAGPVLAVLRIGRAAR